MLNINCHYFYSKHDDRSDNKFDDKFDDELDAEFKNKSDSFL